VNTTELRSIVISLALLVGIGIGGWLIGAELIAADAAPQRTVTASATSEANVGVSDSLIIPRSGLSPFGHHSGLDGRQVLVGRVTQTDPDGVTITTALGEARLTFDDSSFLLRLSTQQPPLLTEGALQTGAAVALLTETDAQGTLTIVSAIALPSQFRPMIEPPQ
jgi:hypothetical protein